MQEPVTANTSKPETPASLRRRSQRLRIIALIVSVMGISGAVLVYSPGLHPPEVSNDPSMWGYDTSVSRQMQNQYGTEGLLAHELADSLKKPGTQATIIIGIAALVAGGCLYVARLLDRDAEHGDKTTIKI
jgi:hypothetical protein